MESVKRGLAAAALFLGLWQALVTFAGLPPFILPGPWRVAGALVDNAGLIAWHAGITLAEVVLGLVLGTALGIATALNLAVSPLARYLIRPALVATQSLPVFALAPILTLWLGYGIWSKVLMAVLIIYFPVASAFFDGLMRTPKGWLDLGQTMGASPARQLWRIRVPAAIPALASGLRLAAVYAPIGAVIGEWVGAAGGLGYLMLLANGRVKIDLMFATLIVLALLTLVLHRLVGWGCDRLLRRLD
ncbi:putative hydroxymethylpyrimidine transport system permease protein [Aliiruegeria haliotis]|uniref:Putative hydroxymethylpyrimidine transport system permease protein n=1 Tax=Aliiruegeria haliotis TaxID=1280846 RepID=A0A2T0RW77_9RHOB|nr:ABC transporter permease [Aliiruegeria haliotis]PRY25446.1 putative hydroxymethylpyrimidine transport system permease protein [Aliiruegeria haliotis]